MVELGAWLLDGVWLEPVLGPLETLPVAPPLWTVPLLLVPVVAVPVEVELPVWATTHVVLASSRKLKQRILFIRESPMGFALPDVGWPEWTKGG